ncbi:MAG: type II toxin-antitoxin system VapC family toxin [Parvularculaceae bacterium]|jgi:predicted nucleic acid-binding protein|nr:type II toxin-antitoxin system VapC family toxin [Parvularculaceae bacterium]
MIVLDASVVIELLLNLPAAGRVASRLQTQTALHAPHLIDAEIGQALRRFASAGKISSGRGREAVDHLAGLPLRRHAHGVLMERVWSLRTSLTAYDALYVALAEALKAPLLTRDRRIAAAHGHFARVELV